MTSEYDTSHFWNDLMKLSTEKRIETLAKDEQRFTQLMKDDTKAFAVWKAFFSTTGAVDPQICKWLLSLRPEIGKERCPFRFEHEGRSFDGCTVLQMMLLLKPAHEYLTLLKDSLQVDDAKGNSSLYYAILSDDFSIYERVWKSCGGDGERSRRPGPETTALLVKFGTPRVLKEISMPYLIESLGGLEAALSLAIKEESRTLANELLKLLKEENLEKFIEMAMNESFVDFETFLMVTEVKHGRPIAEILQRAHSLCQKPAHFKRFLRLVVKCKAELQLTESLDELVAFSGGTFEFLNAIYMHPTTMNTLNALSHCPSSVFDVKSEPFGSYLHVVCKRIGEFEPYCTGSPMHCFTLNSYYLPCLLEATRDEHWTVKDAQGNKPFKYLGQATEHIDRNLIAEMMRRNDSDNLQWTARNDPYKLKNDSCCPF